MYNQFIYIEKHCDAEEALVLAKNVQGNHPKESLETFRRTNGNVHTYLRKFPVEPPLQTSRENFWIRPENTLETSAVESTKMFR